MGTELGPEVSSTAGLRWGEDVPSTPQAITQVWLAFGPVAHDAQDFSKLLSLDGPGQPRVRFFAIQSATCLAGRCWVFLLTLVPLMI